MRRILPAFFAAMMLFSVNAHGVVMNLIYDEEYHYYYEPDVFIEINGKPVETKEMPPVILMDRTLVPVREIFETVGAEVTWIQRTEQTRISYNGTGVLFSIGSRTVTVGRSKVNIPPTEPAPMIINDKTMVPVRILANLLGFDVEWDSSRRTVCIIDNSDVGESGGAESGSSSSSSTTEPETDKPNTDTSDTDKPDNGEVSDTNTPSSLGDITKIHCVTIGNADHIYLGYTKPVKPEISRYSNPERVVLDFSNTVLSFDETTVFDGTTLTSVRVANHPDRARLVLDVKKQPNIEVYKTSTGIVIVASPSSGSPSTTIGDLINGADYTPSPNTGNDNTTQQTPGDSSSNILNGGADNTVNLDTGGTVDTTTTKSFDYNSVVIDPGHGGSDPGAMSASIRESAITLAISKKVEAKLLEAGYRVTMTRNDDNTYPTLQNRVDIASRKTDGKIPAVFVSIHCNSFENPSTNGTQVYYHPDSKYGTVLAQNIYNANVSLTNLRAAQIHDGSHLFVVRKTLQPAALVETAFLSNSSDLAYLLSDSGQEALAQGIFEGIVKTLDTMKADKGL